MNSLELCIGVENNVYKFTLCKYDKKDKDILVAKYFEIEIPQEFFDNKNTSEIVCLIKTTLKDNGIKNNKYKLCLSDKNIINKVINLPKMSVKDLKSFMEHSIEQYFPVSGEEYYFSYRIQSINQNDEKAYYNLFLAAMPKAIVETHANILLECGLKPKCITIFSDSMVKLFSNYTVDSIIVVDVGSFHTEIIVLEKCTIFINSIADFYIPQPQESEERHLYLKNLRYKQLDEDFDVVLENIENYIIFFSSRHNDKTIQQIYFTGEGAELESVLAEISGKFDINITNSKKLLAQNIKPYRMSTDEFERFKYERYFCCFGLVIGGE